MLGELFRRWFVPVRFVLVRARSERGEEFVGAEGVKDVLSGEPGAAELADSVAHLLHMCGVMRIGVDDDFAAQLFCQAEVAVAEIEAVGEGVLLDGYAKLGSAAEDGGEVDVEGLAAEQEASGGMAEDAD